jgi:hypothetical protein
VSVGSGAVEPVVVAAVPVVGNPVGRGVTELPAGDGAAVRGSGAVVRGPGAVGAGGVVLGVLSGGTVHSGRR